MISRKQSIRVLVDAGKASAGPPLGPALGPLGLNLKVVLQVINEKTREFEGMKVPVTISVDPSSKEFEVEVGAPPTSALILKELGLEKASGAPGTDVAGDLNLEQVKRIVKMKKDTLLSYDEESAVREILGTCLSMGVTIEGKNPKEIQSFKVRG
ncbi:MAG: 50S ribosomal protein L11 [Candidatus Methanofastidiosia archaeon]